MSLLTGESELLDISDATTAMLGVEVRLWDALKWKLLPKEVASNSTSAVDKHESHGFSED